LQQAWRVELPPPRHRRLGEFRVGLWLDSPLCEIDSSIRDRFAVAVSALLAAGSSVDETARPTIADAAHHQLFMLLLRAATAARLREEDFAAQRQIAATVTADDMSFRATLARGVAIDHRGWGIANEARTKLRYAWRELFQRYDVLLAPVAATAAPLGLTPAGLPVGMQIIGAEGDDRTTIEFARLLAAEIGGFTPPPAYA
jgi:amidase